MSETGDKGETRERIVAELGPVILAVGLALLLRVLVIDSFRIPSSSMFPTLLIGDHLFVNKLSYGPRIPFTELRLPGLREPRRGDVVVFSAARVGLGVAPADRRPEMPREDFIKRIVGVPGDVVEVREGRLTINGQLVPNDATGDVFVDDLGRETQVQRETLNGCVHDWLDVPGTAGPEGRFTVEPGRYLMMGDNRDNSNDSRIWGTVRFQEMKGPAWRLYFSWDYNGGWLGLLNPATYLATDVRWSRFGRSVACR